VDRFHLVLNLTQAMERELAVNRRHLRIASPSAPALALSPITEEGGKPATLHRWMEQARKTGIHSLVRFVRTLKQDLQAVESAVSTPWSNGPVEGHINRLKMLKRQMYGRAGI
jgi:transposase